MTRCWSYAHCWSVWPISMFGRPDEKPSRNTTAIRRERKMAAHSRISLDHAGSADPRQVMLAPMGTLGADLLDKLTTELAKFPGVETANDKFLALAYAVRDRLLRRWVDSARAILAKKHRTVIYLSAEYLIGPQLGANLLTVDLEAEARTAVAELGATLEALVDHEEEHGLGSGGLGRLAACDMDSLATHDIAAGGHGLRYEVGIFDQDSRDGWQVERTDRWLRAGNPGEIRRYDVTHTVGFGGYTEHDAGGAQAVPDRVVEGVPYDTPIAGYGTKTTNFLRLWSAIASEELDLDAFQVGDYWRAVDAKIRSENLTKVLYPNDSSPAGKQLRLEQQYFFVSCALQDCIRLLLHGGASIREFPKVFAVQLNDTHPTLAIPELMRLLMDLHGLGWDEAWALTTQTFAYTNHTLLPEALETWPLPLVARLLPRHLEIIFEINRRFLDVVRAKFPGDEARVRRMSLIGEDGDRQVRARALDGEAEHPARRRRRRSDRRRSARARAAPRPVRPRLQRQGRADDLSRRRSQRTDLDRRASGLGHRQHEVHAHRRAHARHARRYKRRDPRGRRCRSVLPVRPHRRAGDRGEARWLSPGSAHRRRARHGAVADRQRRILPRRSRDVRAAHPRPARARTVPRLRRLPRLRRVPAARRGPLAGPGELARVVDPQRRARRQVLERPRDRRVRARDLERRADAVDSRHARTRVGARGRCRRGHRMVARCPRDVA